jgi:glyoxylase-like metal-dependent hydrolase (beta-lactamase superfamily II)
VSRTTARSVIASQYPRPSAASPSLGDRPAGDIVTAVSAEAVGVEVSVIRTGEIPAPPSYLYRPQGDAISRLRAVSTGGGDAVITPCLAFVLRHPTAGVIVVDTGFHRDARENLRKDFGIPMSVLMRNLRPAPQPFDEQLRDLGVARESVRAVIMTHLHVDHTSGMRLLPEAQFTISRSEWQATQVRSAPARGYMRHHLPPEERVRLVDPAGEGEPFGPFERTLDLLGDGTIRLLSTPGHTRGHMSLLVRRGRQSDVLLAGDAAYTLRNIRESLLPMLTVDDAASLRSLHELRAFMDAEPSAVVIPTHDPDAWRALA